MKFLNIQYPHKRELILEIWDYKFVGMGVGPCTEIRD